MSHLHRDGRAYRVLQNVGAWHTSVQDGFKRVHLHAYQELCGLEHRRSAVPLGGQRNAGAPAGLPRLTVRQLQR